MINESVLRETLIALTSMLKDQRKALTGAMIELAALRESARGLDPTFEDILAEKRREASRDTVPAQRLIDEIFDDLIRRLEAGEVC